MFYYANWENFCSQVKELGITSCTAEEMINKKIDSPFIIFKHDVEAQVKKALELAKIESKYGINGSYYVQAYLLKDKSGIEVLKEIKKLGHEVSYHYDVLDANNGDMEKAKVEFRKNKTRFEEHGFEINTLCQHGNPLKERKGYNSNRDFFRDQSVIEEYKGIPDVVVNFKEMIRKDYLYISDAGYSWNIIDNPENNDRYETSSNVKLKDFSAIISLLRKGNSIILSTHPHRWENSSNAINLKIVRFQIIRAVSKVIFKIPLAKSIMNRFYYLAKKI